MRTTARQIIGITKAGEPRLELRTIAAHQKCCLGRLYRNLSAHPVPMWLLQAITNWYQQQGPLKPAAIDCAFKELLVSAWPRCPFELETGTSPIDTDEDEPMPPDGKRGGRHCQQNSNRTKKPNSHDNETGASETSSTKISVAARDLIRATAACVQRLTISGLAGQLECTERRIYNYLATEPAPLWLLEGIRDWYTQTGPLQPREIDSAFKKMLARAWPRLTFGTRANTDDNPPPPRGGLPRQSIGASDPGADIAANHPLPVASSPSPLGITTWEEAVAEYTRSAPLRSRAWIRAVIDALLELPQFAKMITPRGRSALQRRLKRASGVTLRKRPETKEGRKKRAAVMQIVGPVIAEAERKLSARKGAHGDHGVITRKDAAEKALADPKIQAALAAALEGEIPSACYCLSVYRVACGPKSSMATTDPVPPATQRSQSTSLESVQSLLDLPFADLIFQAQAVHREHHDPNVIQLSTLLSIKTGGCPEDCNYCPQSRRYDTGVEEQPLAPLETVVSAARLAQANGAGRFCMAAAWRGPRAQDLERVLEMVRAVHGLGLETCVSLGLLQDGQAEQLHEAGLDYYNHNLDTAPEDYGRIITTHRYEDRLDTLAKARRAGLRLCCGGIVGMGEARSTRAGLIARLANLEPQPESVPVNYLVQAPGTPLHGTEPLEWLEFVRTIAAARITMPRSMVRLSAGRQRMPEEIQALCFLAGANSIFYGEKLLTTGNPEVEQDKALLAKLGLRTR